MNFITVISKLFGPKKCFPTCGLKSGFLTKFYFLTSFKLHSNHYWKALKVMTRYWNFCCACMWCKLQNIFLGKKRLFRNLVKIIKKLLPTMFTAFRNHVLYISRFFRGYMQVCWLMYNSGLIRQKPVFGRFLSQIFKNYKFVHGFIIQFWLDFRTYIIL